MDFYYPLLGELKGVIREGQMSKVREEAYRSLVEMLWRCLKVFCRRPSVNYSYEKIVELIKS